MRVFLSCVTFLGKLVQLYQHSRVQLHLRDLLCSAILGQVRLQPHTHTLSLSLALALSLSLALALIEIPIPILILSRGLFLPSEPGEAIQ